MDERSRPVARISNKPDKLLGLAWVLLEVLTSAGHLLPMMIFPREPYHGLTTRCCSDLDSWW